jgi:hypothetical protein
VLSCELVACRLEFDCSVIGSVCECDSRSYGLNVSNRFYDETLGDKALRKLERRPRRDFNFVTPGYFERAAENARLRVRKRLILPL